MPTNANLGEPNRRRNTSCLSGPRARESTPLRGTTVSALVLACSFALGCTLAIVGLRAWRELRQKDPDTSLPNLVALDRILTNPTLLASGPLAVLAIDVGWQGLELTPAARRHVFQIAGQVLTTHKRARDLAFRCSETEFLLIMRGATSGEGFHAADRLHLAFEHDLPREAEPLRNVSIGIAANGRTEVDAAATIRAAGSALAKARTKAQRTAMELVDRATSGIELRPNRSQTPVRRVVIGRG
jgi:GGDEF domain-containing protein